jgi:hypothetical protein
MGLARASLQGIVIKRLLAIRNPWIVPIPPDSRA